MQLSVVRAGSLDLQTKHAFVQILKGLVFNVGLSLWHLQPRFDIWYVCLEKYVIQKGQMRNQLQGWGFCLSSQGKISRPHEPGRRQIQMKSGKNKYFAERASSSRCCKATSAKLKVCFCKRTLHEVAHTLSHIIARTVTGDRVETKYGTITEA